MPKPRRKKGARGHVLGESQNARGEPYVRGKSGARRPAGSDTYVLDGVEHRFDGKCHDDCPNVR